MKKKMAIVVVLCFLLDQVSKSILVHSLFVNQSIAIIPSFFSISYVQNEGAAWSLFSGNQLFLILVSCAAIIILYLFFLKEKKLSKLEVAGFGLLFGGIFGNLIDRIFRGFVVDFFEFTIFGYHFPVFNIADICIVIGVMLIIITLWKGDEMSEKNRSSKRAEEN